MTNFEQFLVTCSELPREFARLEAVKAAGGNEFTAKLWFSRALSTCRMVRLINGKYRLTPWGIQRVCQLLKVQPCAWCDTWPGTQADEEGDEICRHCAALPGPVAVAPKLACVR